MSNVPDIQPVPPERAPDRVNCRTALFEISRPQHSTAIVAARGELDAANADQFVNFALRDAAHTDRLVVDLSGVSFFAAAGFTALHTLNVQCAGAEIRWALVSSPAVDRVLRLCDPDSALPICSNAADAVTTVHTDPPRLLQLVPESS